MTRVGFIGTGNIGSPMAHRILGAGHELRVCDRRQEAAASLLAVGARWEATPGGAAGASDVVFTSLPGPAELEAVVRGDDGLVAGAGPGLVHVDLSTISLASARALRELEGAAGLHFLDCPVSGGAVLAERGALTLMASGEKHAFERVEPVLQALGKRIFYLGDGAGTGTLCKLINNAIFLCAGQLALEGMVLGAKAGLDPTQLLALLEVSSAAMYTGMVPATLARNFEAEGFSLALAEKDIALALDTARRLGVPMPTTAAAHQTYLRGVAGGLGEKLFTATLETLEAAAGTRVPARPVSS